MLRCLRVSRYRDAVASDPSLDGFANVFQLRWLSQVYLSALVTCATSRGSSLQDAWESSATDHGLLNFNEVLGVIFQSLAVSSQNDHDDDTDETLDDVQQQLQSDLEQLLDESVVLTALRRHAPALWESPDSTWTPWLTRKFKTTLGAAVLDGIQQVCSDLDAGDLLLDVEPGPRPSIASERDDDSEEIWITEKTVGGGGIIESFLIRYGEDPRRFFDLVENALRPSDYEIADQQLTILLDWMNATSETEIKEKVSAYRAAASENHKAHANAFDDLRKTLAKRGLLTSHGVIAAIANRIFASRKQRRHRRFAAQDDFTLA